MLAVGLSLCCVLFVAILLCLVDPFRHCDYPYGDNRDDSFSILLFMTCVLRVMVCLLFLLVLLVDYPS